MSPSGSPLSTLLLLLTVAAAAADLGPLSARGGNHLSFGLLRETTPEIPPATTFAAAAPSNDTSENPIESATEPVGRSEMPGRTKLAIALGALLTVGVMAVWASILWCCTGEDGSGLVSSDEDSDAAAYDDNLVIVNLEGSPGGRRNEADEGTLG